MPEEKKTEKKDVVVPKKLQEAMVARAASPKGPIPETPQPKKATKK